MPSPTIELYELAVIGAYCDETGSLTDIRAGNLERLQAAIDQGSAVRVGKLAVFGVEVPNIEQWDRANKHAREVALGAVLVTGEDTDLIQTEGPLDEVRLSTGTHLRDTGITNNAARVFVERSSVANSNLASNDVRIVGSHIDSCKINAGTTIKGSSSLKGVEIARSDIDHVTATETNFYGCRIDHSVFRQAQIQEVVGSAGPHEIHGTLANSNLAYTTNQLIITPR